MNEITTLPTSLQVSLPSKPWCSSPPLCSSQVTGAFGKVRPMLPLCCLQVLAFTQAERSFYWCVHQKFTWSSRHPLYRVLDSWCIHDTFRYWPQVGIQNLMDEDDYRNMLEFKAGWWFFKIAQGDISHIHSCSCTGWTFTAIGQADWLNVGRIWTLKIISTGTQKTSRTRIKKVNT